MTWTEWLPAWLAIAIAGGALLVSYFSLRNARASRESARELDQRDRQDRKQRSARQIDVYWGHDRKAPGHLDSSAVVIRNRGEEAVYNLEITTEVLGERLPFTVPVVPPGWWRSRFFPM